MSERRPIEIWHANIKGVLFDLWSPPSSIHVLEETTSTQDWARQRRAPIGSVIVAWRQTHGRGRLGRTWIDTGEDGVSMTLVLPDVRSERLAIAGGVAAAKAIALACNGATIDVRIKWPNDVLANGRKIAGVLVECADGRAYLGIGINVHQQSWPGELAHSAISLAQLGVAADRLPIMIDVLCDFQVLWGMSDQYLSSRFAQQDVLTGTTCGFRIGDREIRGKVLRVDPMKGLAVLTEHEGEVWLPAATTSVIKE